MTKFSRSMESRSTCSRKPTSGLIDAGSASGAISPRTRSTVARISSFVTGGPAPARDDRRPPGTERRGHEGAGDDPPLHGPRALHDLAEAHNRHLRRVNDAEDGLDALLAEAGDRDRRIRQLRASEAPGPPA